jgi:hypothetical protein
MRASEYPVPDYACYVWHRGDGLAFAFPDGGTLVLPLSKLESDAPGWKWLLATLAARRANAQTQQRSVIGTSARPTQQMLELALHASAGLERTTSVEEDIFSEQPEETRT